MTQPVYPQGILMVKDPEKPGYFVRDPVHQDEAKRYDEWVWNVKTNEELKKIEDRVAQLLSADRMR